jgi:hypothetical protein
VREIAIRYAIGLGRGGPRHEPQQQCDDSGHRSRHGVPWSLSASPRAGWFGGSGHFAPSRRAPQRGRASRRPPGRHGHVVTNAIFGYIWTHRSFGRILVATAGFSPGTCLTSSFQTSTTALAGSAGV